jgi:hypothetical protein
MCSSVGWFVALQREGDKPLSNNPLARADIRNAADNPSLHKRPQRMSKGLDQAHMLAHKQAHHSAQPTSNALQHRCHGLQGVGVVRWFRLMTWILMLLGSSFRVGVSV